MIRVGRLLVLAFVILLFGLFPAYAQTSGDGWNDVVDAALEKFLKERKITRDEYGLWWRENQKYIRLPLPSEYSHGEFKRNDNIKIQFRSTVWKLWGLEYRWYDNENFILDDEAWVLPLSREEQLKVFWMATYLPDYVHKIEEKDISSVREDGSLPVVEIRNIYEGVPFAVEILGQKKYWMIIRNKLYERKTDKQYDIWGIDDPWYARPSYVSVDRERIRMEDIWHERTQLSSFGDYLEKVVMPGNSLALWSAYKIRFYLSKDDLPRVILPIAGTMGVRVLWPASPVASGVSGSTSIFSPPPEQTPIVASPYERGLVPNTPADVRRPVTPPRVPEPPVPTAPPPQKANSPSGISSGSSSNGSSSPPSTGAGPRESSSIAGQANGGSSTFNGQEEIYVIHDIRFEGSTLGSSNDTNSPSERNSTNTTPSDINSNVLYGLLLEEITRSYNISWSSPETGNNARTPSTSTEFGGKSTHPVQDGTINGDSVSTPQTPTTRDEPELPSNVNGNSGERSSVIGDDISVNDNRETPNYSNEPDENTTTSTSFSGAGNGNETFGTDGEPSGQIGDGGNSTEESFGALSGLNNLAESAEQATKEVINGVTGNGYNPPERRVGRWQPRFMFNSFVPSDVAFIAQFQGTIITDRNEILNHIAPLLGIDREEAEKIVAVLMPSEDNELLRRLVEMYNTKESGKNQQGAGASSRRNEFVIEGVKSLQPSKIIIGQTNTLTVVLLVRQNGAVIEKTVNLPISWNGSRSDALNGDVFRNNPGRNVTLTINVAVTDEQTGKVHGYSFNWTFEEIGEMVPIRR